MKQFTSVHDVPDINGLVDSAINIKKAPLKNQSIGSNKTLGMVLLNPSLRTRISTQKAAINLGMNVMVMNMNQESWALEFNDGAIMNGTKVEHIKDAAAIIGQYCDVLAIRCFPGLTNREEDYNELVLSQFIKYCNIPVVSLESATRHPLQSLADLITIKEQWQQSHKPKVVLTWAPHIKALPQAVPNSFSEWMCKADIDFTITHPIGYDLHPSFTQGAKVEYNQQAALQNADFVYVKNWSPYETYGQTVPIENESEWMLTKEKLQTSNQAKIMHCLPVRRNVELADELIDGEDSLVLQQAENRLYAAQVVLQSIINQCDK